MQLALLGVSADAAFVRQVVTQKKVNGWQVSEQSAVGRLARFFPDASPLQIPVSVSIKGGGNRESEETVIEFGTPREALFACRLPLEFAAKVCLQNADRSFEAEAWVVALQYHNGQAAVAARFVQAPPCWVIKL